MWFVDAKFQTRVAHWFDGRGARKSVCGRAWAGGSDPDVGDQMVFPSEKLNRLCYYCKVRLRKKGLSP